MKHRTTPAPRSAFTIVELLVAMALIVFIMYILAEAFAAGTTAFRNLKAIGDMNARLRSVNTTLRRYLSADHFEGRKRLSDLDFWKNGPPQEGFFRIIQSGPSTNEGTDLDGLPSLRSFTQALHFSVKLRGNNRADYFRASVPGGSSLLSLPYPASPPDSRFQDGGGQITSPAAEVAIYLQSNGLMTDDVDFATSSPQPLYTMYFRQRLLVPDNGLVNPAVSYNNPANNWQNYLEVSATQDPNNGANMYCNNLQDVTMPARRWGLPKAAAAPSTNLANYTAANNYLTMAQDSALPPLNGSLAGNDILLSDVLSCHISVLLPKAAYPPNGETFVDLSDSPANAFSSGNPSFAGAGAFVFDTWSSRKDDVYDYSGWAPTGGGATPATIPMFRNPSGTLIGIRAIKIELRIWDSRTKQTRQSSIVVDM